MTGFASPDGRVFVNGVALDEPYAAFEPAPPNPFRDNFPASTILTLKSIPSGGARCRSLSRTASWLCPPGEYFVLGDNRNHSKDSRFWGFVPRQAIIARPLVIYFSLTRPSSTDVQPAQQATDDRLGHEQRTGRTDHGICALGTHLSCGALKRWIIS